MKVDYLENLSFPVGLLAQDSLSGIAEMVKEVFTRTRVDGAERDKLSYWQLIFLQSKANGCSYRGESLPHAQWRWPRDTWFQEQLGIVSKLSNLPRINRGANSNPSWSGYVVVNYGTGLRSPAS
jgi:hypothetical protein